MASIVRRRTIQNYSLVSQLFKIDHKTNFSTPFQTPNLLRAIEQDKESQDSKMTFKKIKRQLKQADEKSVFVCLKWLTFLHKCISHSESFETLQKIEHLLTSFMEPTSTHKYEQYIIKILFKPYFQYLLKLCTFYQISYCQQRDEQIMYLQYNLVIFANSYFKVTVKELKGFFGKYYPCLNQYIGLVGKDVKIFWNTLKMSGENGIAELTFIEIERLQDNISIFDIPKKQISEKDKEQDKENCMSIINEIQLSKSLFLTKPCSNDSDKTSQFEITTTIFNLNN